MVLPPAEELKCITRDTSWNGGATSKEDYMHVTT